MTLDPLIRPFAAVYVRRSSVQNCVSNFITADRGSVRTHNDRTFDARARYFTDWCTRMGLSEHHLQKLDDGGCILLLTTYVKAVKQGDNHLKRSNL